MSSDYGLVSAYNKLSNTSKDWLLFLAILGICTLMPLMGLQYYDTGSDSTFATIFKGTFASQPGRQSANHGNLTLLTFGYQYLYTIANEIDWYGISMIFFSAMATFLFIKIIITVFSQPHAQGFSKLQAFAFAVLFVLYLENVVIIEFTRVAFTLSFFGLLTIVTELKERHGTLRPWYLILGLFAFLIGALVRNQPAMLAFVIVGGLALIYVLRGIILFKTIIKWFAIPLLFLLLLIVNSGIRWDESFDKTPDYGGYLISLWDIHYLKDDIILKTGADSLMYKMVTEERYMADPEHINPEFFKRIGTPYTVNQIHSIPAMLSNNINYPAKFRQAARGYAVAHIGWVFVFLLLSVAAFLNAIRRNTKEHYYLIALFVMFVAIYCAIAMFLKMEERVFCPLILCASVTLAVLVNVEGGNYKVVKGIVAVLLVTSALIELNGVYQRFMYRKNESRLVANVLHYLANRPEKYIFMDVLMYRLYGHPLQPLALTQHQQYPSLDNNGFFLDPNFDKKMQAITGGKTIRECLLFLGTHSTESLVVSEEQKLAKLLYYYKIMYHINLTYSPVIVDFRNGDKMMNGVAPIGVFKVSYAD